MHSIWHELHPSLADPVAPSVEGMRADTVVVGAGLSGLMTGVLLARSGHTDVVVVEERRVGALTTGHTTAKLSLLQGSRYSTILQRHSREMLSAYLEANREGQAWLTRFLDERGLTYEVRDAWTYAATENGMKQLVEEYEACRQVGLEVEWAEPQELSFEVAGAIRLTDQVQLDPLLVLDALRQEFLQHGGKLIEGVRVLDATDRRPMGITTDHGRCTADRLILATGMPFLDRGGHFATLVPQRSYVTTHAVPGDIPRGMYLSIDDPTRSLRTVPTPDGEVLMVGGNGHVTGRLDSEAEAVADLVAWTGRHFPGAQLTHSWSAQDYEPHDALPFARALATSDAIYAVTGFNKWGLANAVAAGLNLSQQILGGQMWWADVLNSPPVRPGGVASIAGNVASVAGNLVKDWAAAELQSLPDQAPAEGEGRVGRDNGAPVATSTVDGKTCRVSAVCTHLGGVLKWNDAERSWDCPLHGSRFAADGSRLEGPAVQDLETR